MNMMAPGSGADTEVKALRLWGGKKKKNFISIVFKSEKERADCVNRRYQHNKGLEKWHSWRVKRERETKIPSQLCAPPLQLSIKAAPAHD